MSEKWNEESILRRAKSLANEVLELFELEETAILGKPNISNDDKTYNLDNQDIVSGTTPYYFTFYGEVVAVKSYIGMLKSVLNILYELDTSILEELAKKKFQVTAANSPYLTTDISELRRGKELGNTGIFYEANLSADYILQFIKAAIEAYDMDGNKIRVRGREELAVVFQHELDHLNGIMFYDHIDKKNPYKNQDRMRAI